MYACIGFNPTKQYAVTPEQRRAVVQRAIDAAQPPGRQGHRTPDPGPFGTLRDPAPWGWEGLV